MSSSVLMEAVEEEGFGGGGMVAPAFGDVQVAGVLRATMTAARMVARLAGPLPVRLVDPGAVGAAGPAGGLAVPGPGPLPAPGQRFCPLGGAPGTVGAPAGRGWPAGA